MAKLAEYRRKRDFTKTAEPAGGSKPADGPRHKLRYLIQKHAASRLHYDFRLELDGVLKSWAVPKGPSLNPADKRLAVHVEDHPIDYGTFEGTIPKGQYGGGTVMLWDRGTWDPIGDPQFGYKKGHLQFELHGERLKGKWQLVRLANRGDGDNNWLLFKSKDDHASEKDVLEEDTSVTSGRSMDEIAAGKKAGKHGKAVWHSNRSDGKPDPEEAAEKPKRAATKKKATKKKHPSGSVDFAATAAALTGAREAAMPDMIQPQLATLSSDAPHGDKWIHELKVDGYRVIAFIADGRVRLMTRRGQDWTDHFPTIAEALKDFPVRTVILDGEAVVMKPNGTTDFQALQNAIKGESNGLIRYFAFDMPYCDGIDLTRVPLLDRKELLRQVVETAGDGDILMFSEHVVGSGEKVFKLACDHGMEGIVSKHAESPYEPRRTRTWLKIKCNASQEFVIGGYSDPQRSRIGFGALLLGYYDKDGKFTYAGRVGTGFTDETLQSLHAELKKRETKETPFANPPTGAEARDVHWVRPELVGNIEFANWTSDGLLRHPSFQGLREDKLAREVIRELPTIPPSNGNGEHMASRKKSAKGKSKTPSPSGRGQGEGRSSRSTAHQPSDDSSAPAPSRRRVIRASRDEAIEVAGVRITSPDRVVYPDVNLTKLDVARYYEAAAERMLPHVVERPLSIVRCPEGQTGECFFQKHVSGYTPPGVLGVKIREKNATKETITIKDITGLVGLAQIGALEIHTWGCHNKDVEKPDLMIFDLDPGPDVDWPQTVKAARALHDKLDQIGLETFVKTSGGKGLHVVAPLRPTIDWDTFKEFTRAVVEHMVEESPDKYVEVMTKSRRAGKVFIDYLRNGRGATCVAPFSTRARPGAPLSIPVSWNELAKVRPDGFAIPNITPRLTAARDPWEGFLTVRQSLKK